VRSACIATGAMATASLPSTRAARVVGTAWGITMPDHAEDVDAHGVNRADRLAQRVADLQRGNSPHAEGHGGDLERKTNHA
jgi:hypothetical protein